MTTKLIYTFILFLFYLYQFICFENIMQKQYYDISRFYRYTFKSKILFYKLSILIICAILSFFPFKSVFLLFPLLFFIDVLNQTIVPFKFSKRVIRHFLIFVLTFLLTFYFIIQNSLKILFIFSILNFVIIFILSYLLSLFIEYLIILYYKNKAKEKLKSHKELKIICITGSYGKTSSKNYLFELLKDDYKVCVSPASYNSLNGVLITINNYLKSYHQVLILEIGVDKKNGMNKFIKWLHSDIAFITSIGPQHLATFKTLDNIKNEKTKLLKSLSNDKLAIINIDDENLKNILLKCSKIEVSCNQKADIYIENVTIVNGLSKFDISIFNKKYSIYTKLLGKYHLNNLLLCIACAKQLKVSDEKILNTIKELKNIDHRLSTYKDNNLFVIDDSYNSNYNGFIQALDILDSFNNYKVLITPGLIELNNEKEKIHSLIAKKINNCCDFVCLIGENSKNLVKHLKVSYEYFETFKEAYWSLKQLNKNITLLIENDLPDIYI